MQMIGLGMLCRLVTLVRVPPGTLPEFSGRSPLGYEMLCHFPFPVTGPCELRNRSRAGHFHSRFPVIQFPPHQLPALAFPAILMLFRLLPRCAFHWLHEFLCELAVDFRPFAVRRSVNSILHCLCIPLPCFVPRHMLASLHFRSVSASEAQLWYQLQFLLLIFSVTHTDPRGGNQHLSALGWGLSTPSRCG